MTKWRKKLTVGQREHLREMGVATLKDLQSQADYHAVERAAGGRTPCYECGQIIDRLGMVGKVAR